MKQLILLGGGGHAREILDIVVAINQQEAQFDVVGVAADGYWDAAELTAHGVERLGGIEDCLKRYDSDFVIAIGDPQARSRIDALASSLGRKAATLIHPESSIGTDSTIAAGTVIAGGSRITTHVSIGRHVYIGPNAVVSHDCIIGDFVSVFTGACVSGRVAVGSGVTLGASSCIIEKLSIGSDSTIGAGAIVVSDIPSGVVAVGNPARVTIP